MKVLYVVGSCLTKNTSANMSHNGYVQGLLENGCQVDILMAEDSWGAQDKALPTWEQASYFRYPSVAWQDRLRQKARGAAPAPAESGGAAGNAGYKKTSLAALKSGIRRWAKTMFYKCFPADPLYPLEKTWLKHAAGFRSDTVYDLVISNSSPAASHKLVGQLLKQKRLSCKRWVQIWEDPWFFDLYGGHGEIIREEEHALLREASEIYYVSPLTLKYQQRHYADCAHKMKHIPLPYFDFAKEAAAADEGWSFGYFGDYYAQTRNLVPFYEALVRSGHGGYIYGDSDESLRATDRIEISGRVTLDVLDKVQAKTRVLVHLCNLRGGQIPGKIYHYCATDKPILFILDGTPEEREILKSYFSQFDRFYFCENQGDSILRAIDEICSDGREWTRLEAFSPKVVVRQLLK